jgi:hypothetical protein
MDMYYEKVENIEQNLVKMIPNFHRVRIKSPAETINLDTLFHRKVSKEKLATTPQYIFVTIDFPSGNDSHCILLILQPHAKLFNERRSLFEFNCSINSKLVWYRDQVKYENRDLWRWGTYWFR